MIIGIGTDIVSVTRLNKAMETFGEEFIDRILTHNERKIYDARLDKQLFFAGRWAAKEAISKALGTGIGGGMGWTDTEITNDSAGRPVVTFFGTTREMIARLRLRKCHITISHDTEYATATIILEA